MIRIQDTLSLSEFEISESLIPALPEGMEVISEPYELPFDTEGNLL